MTSLADGFQALPEEFQAVIRLAQERYGITVVPLQALSGGFSGASIYLVSVAFLTMPKVEHYILKLDRKRPKSSADEIARYELAISQSPTEFADRHIARMAFDRLEHEGAIAIFYAIAGQSLNQYRTLSAYEKQAQLEIILAETYTKILDCWNSERIFQQSVHPRVLLERWLGFRLKPGNQIANFIESVCRLPADIPGFLINGRVYPNPLVFATDERLWDKARPIDAAMGLQHGDLNANNILVKVSRDNQSLDGFYLIDFAMFKEGMPLLYDLRYVEMSYLTFKQAQASVVKVLELIAQLGESDRVEVGDVPVDMAGESLVIASTRTTFERWVTERHPSLHDDLWGQYWLAGVAVGLSYCHKVGLGEEERLAALVYAAANMKRYLALFGLPHPTEGGQLYQTAGLRRAQAPGISGSPGARPATYNLPVQPTPFIGREAHVAALKDLLLDPKIRLITLTGPGGAGKTRLSLQAAQGMVDSFRDGVYFVPLADDTNEERLISRLAQQLAVREGGRPLLDNVKDFLRDKRILLVLDNFEQLVSAASLVADLLAAAPQLKVLTSSRIALRLHGEHEYPVPPLDLPQADALDLGAIAENESVRLFVARARAARPNFLLEQGNAAPVVEICRRLDGLPLAIELAAARIKLLPPQAILTRLDDRLKLLTGGARDMPFRHQTLRNTLEWSYSLLAEAEKTLYARLSVFVGGFSFAAADAVCNPENEFDLLDGLTALLDNSLLRQEITSSGEPRFSMLETIRAYALERLEESGELSRIQNQHAQYFGLVFLDQAHRKSYGPKAEIFLSEIEIEHDNLRAVLGLCVSSPKGHELAAWIFWELMWFWYRRGYLNEGRIWTERLLDSQVDQLFSRTRAIALTISGMMAMWQGEQDLALRRLEEGLAIGQMREDEELMPLLLLGNGVIRLNLGRDQEAKMLLQETRALFKQADFPYFQHLTNVHLGNVELGLGNIEQARRLHEEAYIAASNIGEKWLISFAANNLGEVARVLGQYDLAKTYYEESAALLQDTGDQGDVARFVHNLGYVALHEGDENRAEAQFRKSLSMFRRLGNRRGMAECMAGLAGLRARQGQTEWAAVMLSAAGKVLETSGGAWWPADRREIEENQAIIGAALSEAELAAAQEKGGAMSLEQALAFVSA